MNLMTLWQQIADEQQKTGATGLSVRRIDAGWTDDLFIGIRLPAGTRMFLLRLPTAPKLSRNAVPQSRGFVTHIARFEHDPEHSCNLVLEATEPSFNPVFAVLVDDLVQRIVGRRQEQTAVSAFVTALQHWKKFFDAVGPEGLSEEKLLGLLAELYFLREFAIRNVPSPVAAVAGWVGPDPLAKDFEYSRIAVEVKATAVREPVKVGINGERQLDDHGIENLFLFVLMTERAAAGGTTVSEMVQALRALLAESPALFPFEEKLLAYGYLDVHRPKYEASRFIIHRHGLFHVRSGFPRLTSTLPQGVGDISYTVTLSACEPFHVSDSALTDLMSLAPAYDA